MSVPAVINVDVGIDKCAELVDGILSRRQDRQDDFLRDLRDDLDALSAIVGTLDNIFIALIQGFKSQAIVSDPEARQELLDATMTYLMRRELLPRLETLQGTITAAAYDSKLEPRKYRELVQTLRSLSRRLGQYREELGEGAITGVGQRQKWNLMTLWEQAMGEGYGGGQLEANVAEIAEEVFRNHDFDLSDNIHKLIGTAKLQTRTVVL